VGGRAERHGLETHLDLGVEQHIEAARKSGEGARASSDRFIGPAGRPVHAHLDVPGRIVLEQLYLGGCDQAGVGEDAQQEAQSLQTQVDLGEVLPQQRLAAGDQAPYRPHIGGLLGDIEDLLEAQFRRLGGAITGRKVDIAMAAVVVAARGNLEVEGEGARLAASLSQRGKS